MDEFDCLVKLGSLVKDIYFCEIPDFSILDGLVNGDGKINIHLPQDKVFTYLGEYSGSYINSSIISVNFETDIFIDSDELYEYPNLCNLVLTCTNHRVTSFDDEDLMNMFRAIINLTELKSLAFDIRGMQDYPIEQIKLMFGGNEKTLRVPIKIMSERPLRKRGRKYRRT